jgi:hypothetical protein
VVITGFITVKSARIRHKITQLNFFWKTTWATKEGFQWAKIEEVKGMGIQATDKEGNTYWAGSFKTLNDKTTEDGHNIYIQKNNQLIGWIDVADQIRPEAKEVIDHLFDDITNTSVDSDKDIGHSQSRYAMNESKDSESKDNAIFGKLFSDVKVIQKKKRYHKGWSNFEV